MDDETSILQTAPCTARLLKRAEEMGNDEDQAFKVMEPFSQERSGRQHHNFCHRRTGNPVAGGTTYRKPLEAVQIGTFRQTDGEAGLEAAGKWPDKD